MHFKSSAGVADIPVPVVGPLLCATVTGCHKACAIGCLRTNDITACTTQYYAGHYWDCGRCTDGYRSLNNPQFLGCTAGPKTDTSCLSHSATKSATQTRSSSQTPTKSQSVSASESRTRSLTPSPSQSKSHTASPSRSASKSACVNPATGGTCSIRRLAAGAGWAAQSRQLPTCTRVLSQLSALQADLQATTPLHHDDAIRRLVGAIGEPRTAPAVVRVGVEDSEEAAAGAAQAGGVPGTGARDLSVTTTVCACDGHHVFTTVCGCTTEYYCGAGCTPGATTNPLSCI